MDDASAKKWPSVRRRYIARWNSEGMSEEDLIVVVEGATKAIWTGVTAFRVDKRKRLNYLRERGQQGLFVYGKDM